MSAVASALDRQKNLRTRYGALLFALALFGYPIVGSLVSLLNIESRLLSVPFRLFVGLMGLFMFATMGRMRFDNWRLLILLIWCALILRLCFDTLVAGIDGADYALGFFIVGSVLPVFALWKLDAYDQERFALAGFITATIGSLISLFGNYAGAFGASDLTELTGRLSSASLNPVSLGHLAVSGFFCGLVLMRKTTAWRLITIAVVMGGLIVVVVQTGSKGPLLSLAIALSIWSVRRGIAGRSIVLVASLTTLLVLYGDNPLFERLLSINEDPSTSDRIVLIQDSWQQILSSPWVGSASVELNAGYYPHNILLEAAMSFGLPLTVILVIVLLRGLIISWRLLNKNCDLIALLYIQALVISIISGALFTDSMLWVCLIMLFGTKWSAIKNKKLQLENPIQHSKNVKFIKVMPVLRPQ